MFCNKRRLAYAELDGVRPGFYDGLDGFRHVFDALQKADLAEKAVVDGDIETLAVGGEHALESG